MTTPNGSPDGDRAFTDVTVRVGGTWVAHQDVYVAAGAVSAITDTTASPDTGPPAVLIPGFVNTHTHLQQSLMRGIAECTQLLEWLLAIGEQSVAITPQRVSRGRGRLFGESPVGHDDRRRAHVAPSVG